MDSSNFPIVCHWGGNVYEESGQICHEGGRSNFVIVSRGACLLEMLQKIYVATQIPPSRSLCLKMKFPMNGGNYMLMPLLDELAVTNMWMIIDMESMSSLEIYIEESIGDSSTASTTSNDVVSRHGVNAGNSSNDAVLDMVIEEDGMYLHNGASFVDGQASDDDADENINGDDMTESDEDDGDTVRATTPSSHFTRIYDLPEGFTDAWMSGAGMKRFTPEGEFEVGQQFDNKEQVINMVSLYSIKGCLNPFLTVIIRRITMDLILCTIHPCFRLREDLSPHVLRMRWMKVPEERLDVENVNKLAIIGPHVRRDHQEMKWGSTG
ncbi:unnamed protein product [Cuscuta epithymum]|nr:unnamed protein product [Cuscuta epithymum]CAH9140772.1 unnamed protein product [Cuscuta epithymum]